MSNAMQKQGPQTLKVTPVDTMMLNLMGEMSKREARIENLLPTDMPIERFTESVRFALAQEPALLKCDPGTVLIAVMKAAKLGVDVAGGALGHGYLVPFGKECTFVPGYKGLVMLAVVSGVVRDMTPVLVYDKDEFVPEEGDAPRLVHKPYVPRKASDSRGDIIAAYTRVLLPDGSRVIKGLLYADDIARIEAGVAKGGPWGGRHRPEQVKKSSIKNAFKTLGVPSTEQTARLREALTADVEAEARETSGPATHALAPEPEKATDRLKKHLRADNGGQRVEPASEIEPVPVSGAGAGEPPPGMALGDEPGAEG